MPIEVEKVLSTGRKMKAVVSVRDGHASVALGFDQAPTETERKEAWAVIDKVMHESGFDSASKPITLKGPRSNPSVN